MEGRNILIQHLQKIRKQEFYKRLVRIIFLSFFAVLSPLAIVDQFKEQDIFTAIFLLIAELIFIGIVILLYRSAIEFNNISNSRIYQCIDSPEKITEIVVTPTKIVFEIKGMEDETIFLNDNSFRKEFLASVKNVFGNNKIVIQN